MYTIISGTNRIGSNTLKVAREYQYFFTQKNIHCELLSLEKMNSLYRNATFEEIENNILIPTKKFIIIVPEYNGVFPGIFKLMLDHTTIEPCWRNKKVMLVGVSNGRAGNLRGLDTLNNMFNYLGVHVLPTNLPLSNINAELQMDKLCKQQTMDTILLQIDKFISF